MAMIVLPKWERETRSEAVVDQLDEACHGSGVEDIGGRRLILLRSLADVVQPADEAVGFAIDDGQALAVAPLHDGNQILTRSQRRLLTRRQVDLGQAARLERQDWPPPPGRWMSRTDTCPRRRAARTCRAGPPPRWRCDRNAAAAATSSPHRRGSPTRGWMMKP